MQVRDFLREYGNSLQASGIRVSTRVTNGILKG